MAFHIQALVLFSVAFLCDYCFSQDQKGDPLRAENRKNFCLLDQDYFFNIRQNESGIILKIGNTLFHPDTERYLTCKLRHLLIYGMKKMAVHANYTDDKLDEFYLRNRNQVKKKMCDIFLKIYNDFTFQGNYTFLSTSLCSLSDVTRVVLESFIQSVNKKSND